ncbi:hypothetical protein EIP91_008779 [Steccherinum ochraceum]|uniref:Amino acid transporter transmembrane domain-containing protein n=1 Tax=Steccherinum ochraceum TaxID=92696 RepID=A0A4R0R2D3_9APHY|nr:hypothetical protein EIP91_008779 [Steccherinum ochraceum]
MSGSPRSSTSSGSFGSDHEPVNGYDSSAALIVVHDPDDQDLDPASFDFTSDDEDAAEEEQLERLRSSSVPPLPALSVFLYLLSPLLKFGAIQVVDASKDLQLKWAITALAVFACLCALTRQVWYMLAKYVRRADMETVLLETFARGRGREMLRDVIRQVVRFSIGLFRVLLAVMYLRASVDVLLPLFTAIPSLDTRAALTPLLALCLAPLCFPKSLAGISAIYTGWISIVTFVAWLIARAYAHARNIRPANPAAESLGILWQGISIFAFVFTTSGTLPLYASLKGGQVPGQPKPKRARRFTLLSAISIAVAALLILPLIFFGQPPSLHAQQVLPAPSRRPTPNFRIALGLLNACTLALTVPSIVITTPPLPIPRLIRRSTNFPVSKALLYIVTVCLAAGPVGVVKVISDVVFVLAFFSTYVLPAFIHIIIHTFRRPLSIVIPPSTPITPSSSTSQTHPLPSSSTPYPPSPYSAGYTAHLSPTTTESRHDELLQRKERLLQRKRLGKRLGWDIGVWVLLLPVGGGGLVWIAGRIWGKW